MGCEIECDAVIDGLADHGKALLETDYVLFRGAQHRVKLLFTVLTSIDSTDSELTLRTADHDISLALGSKAATWADKIANPKSLLEKLGVKAGESVALVDVYNEPFLTLLGERGIPLAAELTDARLVFLQVASIEALEAIATLAPKLGDGGALWVIFPKSRADFPNGMVNNAGRAAGLTDVKVCAFSATYTALKFVRRKP